MPHITLTDADSGSTASIAVEFGFNCYEFVAAFRGQRIDVLAAQPEFVERGEKPSWSGIPLLFPFPNRIKNSRFVWDGREYVLPPDKVGHAGDYAIHGFCLDRPWRITQQTAASVTGEFRLSQDAPDRRALWLADFTIVDLKKRWTVEEPWLQSRCGWSPFTGVELTGKPVGTIVRGQVAMWEDTLADAPSGAPIKFESVAFG